MVSIGWTRVQFFGVPLLSLETGGHVLSAALAALLATVRKERVHAIASVSVVLHILLTFSRFQIG